MGESKPQPKPPEGKRRLPPPSRPPCPEGLHVFVAFQEHSPSGLRLSYCYCVACGFVV